MAYFDSPKNRALWDKELEGLRKEKVARAKGTNIADKSINNSDYIKSNEAMGLMSSPIYEGPVRERTSYKQLLAEEAASVRNARDGKVRVAHKYKNEEMTIPQNRPLANASSGF